MEPDLNREDFLEGVDVYSVMDPEQKKREKLSQDEAERLIRAVREMLSAECSRRFIWWILDRGNLFHSGYTGNAIDQVHMDGTRILAAEVFALCLKADPFFLSKMINEAVEKKRREDN